ncbi:MULTISPECIES: ABC transporter permease subunit [unclassified Paenibacillus]|uniref:ABC transporter permease n=1 Tax=unclassified Paenibacillus TaxID=185978 RepID=UPI0009558E50|nr:MULTISPECIES: ABC transporter permease subunit [unclassified Paenibacillus]ASS68409.1 sugar ABC transporter permease [Paenibacillus sp. RUD330]SIR32273.1 putative aldouronate transport system permease protein [Paenibacillus sp. RU4X]SIR43576.1 putative aldouronate transport system permease protein [Paenibacillus sp. RU4T]
MKGFLQELSRNRIMFLMILPALIFFVVFSYIPMVGVYYAFTNFDFEGGLFGSEFVGMQNFKFLYDSGVLWNLTKNTVLYNLAFILLGNALQLLCAIFLSELPGKWFRKLTQSIMFLPFFVSFVLVGAFVFNLFNSSNGVINTVLVQLGLQPYDFYLHTAPWKYIIIFFNIWKGLGYGTIIYLAAIMSISDEYHEAAKIDGANIFKRIRYITLPMLVPTFILLILLSLGGILKGQFDLFYQIIGSNGVLYNSTDIIDTYVYRSLAVNFDIGMGTAAGLYQSFFGLVLVVAVNYIIRKTHKDYALF